MTKVLSAKIEHGKIIPKGVLPKITKETQVKIFVYSPKEKTTSYFGKGKDIFGDGLKYQKKIRKEWK